MGSAEAMAARRDREHVRLWIDAAAWMLEEQAENHARDVARLEAVVAARDAELEARPERVVYLNLDQQTVWDAEQERDHAFQSRDTAFKTLTEVRLLHREKLPGRCSCGKPLNGCATYELLDGYQALERWERKQVDRAKRGLNHMLPLGHPELLDRRGWATDDAD